MDLNLKLLSITQLLQSFSKLYKVQIYGIGLDNFLHFFIAALIFYILQKKHTVFNSFLILTACILLKEFIDAFKYLRLENLNIPLKSIDTMADITAGYDGAFCVNIIKKVKGEKEIEENIPIV